MKLLEALSRHTSSALGVVVLLLSGVVGGMSVGLWLSHANTEDALPLFALAISSALVLAVASGLAYTYHRFIYQRTKSTLISHLEGAGHQDLEALANIEKSIRAGRYSEAFAAIPPGWRDFGATLFRLGAIHLKLTTMLTLVGVTTGLAMSVVAIAVVVEQNDKIETQNGLIGTQNCLIESQLEVDQRSLDLLKAEIDLAKAQEWQALTQWAEQKYESFKGSQTAFPKSPVREVTHYLALPPDAQAATRAFWNHVWEQWQTLTESDGETTTSMRVWDEYLVRILQSSGHRRSQSGALCQLIRDDSWPAKDEGFVEALVPAVFPTEFLTCCRGEKVIDLCSGGLK